MRALFARLDFKGAPEPLKRIALAGRGHAQNLAKALMRFTTANAPPAERQAKPKAVISATASHPARTKSDPATVLVRCANQDMGQMVADILRELRLTPLFYPHASAAQHPVRPALCILAAPEPMPAVVASLQALTGTPVIILDESFGRNRSAWLAQPGVRAVLPVPFEVPELLRTIEALLRS
jgi:hypothetical protein